MKIIHQRHNNCCAIATMAMLTGYSYNFVFRMVYGKKKRKEYPGLGMEHVLRFLDKLHIKYRLSFNRKDVERLKNNALIAVDFNDRRKEFSYDEHVRHAIAWDHHNKTIIRIE